MKKAFFLFSMISVLVLNSCSIDSDEPSFYVETLPVASVDLPTEFVYGQSHDIIDRKSVV